MPSPQKKEPEPDPLFHRVVEGITGHLADRLVALPTEVFAGITDRIIPQGAAELSQAIFTGNAYAPYGPALRPLEPETPGHGVHGPEPTLEERAADIVALNEAKANAMTQRQIDKNVSELTLTPEEQKFADFFRQPPEPSEPDEPEI